MVFVSINCRHCLWIVGNGTTLSKSESIWERLVSDAKDRGCFFNSDAIKSITNAKANTRAWYKFLNMILHLFRYSVEESSYTQLKHIFFGYLLSQVCRFLATQRLRRRICLCMF